MVFFYLYVILLQETFSVLAEKREETCRQDNCENVVEGVKIHWELNGLSQDDPVLIENIKNNVLWVVMKCLQLMPKNIFFKVYLSQCSTKCDLKFFLLDAHLV